MGSGSIWKDKSLAMRSFVYEKLNFVNSPYGSNSNAFFDVDMHHTIVRQQVVSKSNEFSS